MIGEIYLVICSSTGKWYFGQTIKPIQNRLKEHLTALNEVLTTSFTEPYESMVRRTLLLKRF